LNSLPNSIEPIIEINDLSFYYFIALILIGIVGIYFLVKLAFKIFKYKRDDRKKSIESLRKLNWSQSKNTAYKITKYGRLIAGERSEKLLDELIESLERYKYRKDEIEINNNIKNRLNIFLEVVESE